MRPTENTSYIYERRPQLHAIAFRSISQLMERWVESRKLKHGYLQEDEQCKVFRIVCFKKLDDELQRSARSAVLSTRISFEQWSGEFITARCTCYFKVIAIDACRAREIQQGPEAYVMFVRASKKLPNVHLGLEEKHESNIKANLVKAMARVKIFSSSVPWIKDV